MAYLENYFIEAVSGFSGTDDQSNPDWQDAKLVLESKSSERKDYLGSLLKDINKMMGVASTRNKEIFDTKGDITTFEINLLETIQLLEGKSVSSFTGGSGGDSVVQSSSTTVKSDLSSIRGLYTHFKMHKRQYMEAFKTDNTAIKGVYVSGVWLIVSYLAATCMYNMRPTLMSNPAFKYGRMIKDLHKVITSTKYISYMEEMEDVKINTEALMFEGVFAVSAAIVSMVVLVRLIIWNVYTMRTKLSDKLKVTAEYMERNVSRLKNKDMKNKDKIIGKQQKAIVNLNKAAETLRIKLDDEKVSSPPAIKGKRPDDSGSGGKNDSDSDDDFIL